MFTSVIDGLTCRSLHTTAAAYAYVHSLIKDTITTRMQSLVLSSAHTNCPTRAVSRSKIYHSGDKRDKKLNKTTRVMVMCPSYISLCTGNKRTGTRLSSRINPDVQQTRIGNAPHLRIVWRKSNQASGGPALMLMQRLHCESLRRRPANAPKHTATPTLLLLLSFKEENLPTNGKTCAVMGQRCRT